MSDKRRNGRNMSFAMNIVYLIIGIIIVIMFIFVFLSPESHKAFFPIIFLLAAVLSFINGATEIAHAGREKKQRILGVGNIAVGICLLAVSVISGISIL